jgi:hypothetical protein
MVGSVVVTVPVLFYLLNSKPEAPHGLKPHRSVTQEVEAHEEDSKKTEKPSERDPVRRSL